jgi:predicted RNA methylase
MPDAPSTLPHADLTVLLAALPGCEVVAHVDLSARTVLRSDSVRRLPQEHLEALCNWGADVLGAGAVLALALDDTALRVARRLADPETGKPGTEGLCLMLPPFTDPSLALACLSKGAPG